MTGKQIELMERMAISCFKHIYCSECSLSSRCHDGCMESFLRWFSSGEIDSIDNDSNAWSEDRTLEQIFDGSED